MKTARRVFVMLLCTLILSFAGSAAAEMVPAGFEIPYLDTAPEIDGTIGEEEWRQAASVTGGVWRHGQYCDALLEMDQRLSRRQFIFWLGWDEDNIYLASRSYVMPGVRPEFIGQLESDNLELVFFPFEAGRLRPYKIHIGYDYTFECEIMGPWDHDIDFAARLVSDPESTYGSGTRLWELEARIPRENFRMERPNRAGDRWHMLLVRNYSNPREQIHLPVAEGFSIPRGYARAVLKREVPSVQFRDALPLMRGRAGVGLQFYNPGGKTERFVKDITINRLHYHRRRLTGEETVYQATREFEVAPGEVFRHVPEDSIDGLPDWDRARVKLTVSSPQRGDILTYQARYRYDGKLAELEQAQKAPIGAEIGKMVFCREDGLYVATLLNEERIAFRRDIHDMPRISPDGRSILLTSYYGGEEYIFHVDIDGRKLERLARGGQARWTPDGEHFVFVRDGRIFRQHIDGTGPVALTPDGWDACSFPAVDPSGEKLLFVMGRILYVMQPGEESKTSIRWGRIDSPPAWSPCGTLIAYQNGSHIYVTDMAGESRVLADEEGVKGYPVWSVAGDGVAYVRRPGPEGAWQLRAIDSGRTAPGFTVLEDVPPADLVWKCLALD